MARNRPLRPGETAPMPAPARRAGGGGGGGNGGGNKGPKNNKPRKNRGPQDPPAAPLPSVGVLGTTQATDYIRQNPQEYVMGQLRRGGLNPTGRNPFDQFLANDFYAMADDYLQRYKQETDQNANMDKALAAMSAPYASGNPFTSSSGLTGTADANMARYLFLSMNPLDRGERAGGMGQPGRWSPWG